MKGAGKMCPEFSRRSVVRGGARLGLGALSSALLKANAVAMTEGEEALEISPLHLACLRQLRFVWVPNVESGGPSVDFEAPFGSSDVYADLARIAKMNSKSELKRLYAAVMVRLAVFTEKGKLAPGHYSLPRETVLRLKRSVAASGISDDGFHFTAEHAKLINALRWVYLEPTRYSFVFNLSLDPEDWTGFWRVPSVNFKRPFGDMTYFEIDMAAVLGLPFRPNSNDPNEARFSDLYQQMHAALQIFVMNAAL
jgi:hypothetical protein